MFGFLPGIVWDLLFLLFLVYVGMGALFAGRAASTERALDRKAEVKELLLVGVGWLPLLISDPKDFNSIEVLRVRQERREQKAYERKSRLAEAQQVTIQKRVNVEKERADLEAIRTKSEAEIDRHRQRADEFINLRHAKELSASSKGEEDEVVEVEIVDDFKNRNLPLRYENLRVNNDDVEEVWDRESGKWVPKWSMIPGYQYRQFG